MQSKKSIKRENSKKENLKVKAHSGITLIALVITIIVLLILAGVALSALTGDSGILNNAESAKGKTNLANAKEQVELAVQGAKLENVSKTGEMTVTYANLKNELDNIVGSGKYEIDPEEEADSWTVTVGEYEATVQANGKIEEPENSDGGDGTGDRDTTTLPSVAGKTTPWLPTGFRQVEGTTLDNGLTITNATGLQNYVWIEVPTTIEATLEGEDSPTKLLEAENNEEIMAILEVYAGDYTKGSSSQNCSSWKEEWYDLYNATWDGESEYAYIANKSSSNLTKWKDYYGQGNVYYSETENGEKLVVNSFESSDYVRSHYYYVKVNESFKNHSDGCGLTYDKYQIAYSSMLKSIKKYGGFWLSQYEAGIAYDEGNRTYSSSRITDNPTPANYAKDQYPYNYVYCSEAQKIANADSVDGKYTSSLPFGIQWDLVCKFLEVKNAKTYSEIATDSTWGNYYNTGWTSSANSKYSDNNGTSFTAGTKTKSSGEYLLTTGAIESTTSSLDASPMNIYDFAGNVYEWTLERATVYASSPCASRGGLYSDNSGDYQAASRYNGSQTTSLIDFDGFRSTLY